MLEFFRKFRVKQSPDTELAPDPVPTPCVEAKPKPPPAPAPAPAKVYEPRAHAKRLVCWLQQHSDGGPQQLDFDEVSWAYDRMCDALGWRQEPWAMVGRHFTKLTGGRRYRCVWNPRTGRRDNKQRFYEIPDASTHRGQVTKSASDVGPVRGLKSVPAPARAAA